MMNNDIMKRVMEQKLMQELLIRVPEEQREDAMRMVKDIVEGVQEKMNAALPAIQSVSPVQLEKILREQVK